MIKLTAHSDIHLEHGLDVAFTTKEKFPHYSVFNLTIPTESDYLILAGDIGNLGLNDMRQYFISLTQKYPNTKILYVLGNHEFYGLDFDIAVQAYKQELANIPNVYLLEKDKFVDNENKILFIGATLWTDFLLGENQQASVKSAVNGISDFEYINEITPELMIKEFNQTIQYIQSTVNNPKFKDYKKVMISHFLPHINAFHPRYKYNQHGLITSAYWGSHIPNIVELFDVWFYGHSHENIYFNVGKTKVYSNQLGYPHKNVAGIWECSITTIDNMTEDIISHAYNPNFLIEI